MMNPYQELGIASDASKEEAKVAFRALAFRWHPDRCKDPDAEDKMKRLNQAVEMILHPERQPAQRVVHWPQPTVIRVHYGFAGASTSTSNDWTGGTYGAGF